MSSPKVKYSYANGTSNTIRPTSVTYPDGKVLSFDYGTSGGMNDKLSRVESLGFDGTGNLVQPAYLGLGTQVRTTLSEPQVRWDLATGSSPNPYAGLDRFGRVIDNKWTNYNTSTTLDQIKYTYDRASNRTSRENVVAKAQTTPKYFDELYGYDGSNRLSLMERGQLAGSPPSSITNKQFAQDWGLDPTGNWKVFKEDANGDGTWELNQTRTSNPVNEITAINETAGPSWVTPGYDSAGNMTTIPRPSEPTGDFTGVYDAWNRLVELQGLGSTVVARYEYDGLTRRVVKHTFPGWEELEAADWDAMSEEDWNGLQLTQAHRRDYYYNSSWQILEERVENDTAFERQYVWGLQYIDGLVFRDRQLTSSVERSYVLQDANWNVTALTDDNGAVVERYSYSAYGVPTTLNPDFTPAATQEAYDWDVLYAGYKWDSESALYQVRFRYLQPALGTWVSRDPIGYKSKDYNFLRYNNSMPLLSIDPLGLAWCIPVAGGAGACASASASQSIQGIMPPAVTPPGASIYYKNCVCTITIELICRAMEPDPTGWLYHCFLAVVDSNGKYVESVSGIADDKPNSPTKGYTISHQAAGLPMYDINMMKEYKYIKAPFQLPRNQDACKFLSCAKSYAKDISGTYGYNQFADNSNTFLTRIIRHCEASADFPFLATASDDVALPRTPDEIYWDIHNGYGSYGMW